MRSVFAKCSAHLCTAVGELQQRASAFHNRAWDGCGRCINCHKEIREAIVGKAEVLIIASVPACLGFCSGGCSWLLGQGNAGVPAEGDTRKKALFTVATTLFWSSA